MKNVDCGYQIVGETHYLKSSYHSQSWYFILDSQSVDMLAQHVKKFM